MSEFTVEIKFVNGETQTFDAEYRRSNVDVLIVEEHINSDRKFIKFGEHLINTNNVLTVKVKEKTTETSTK
ncbi:MULTISPECIES: hypothetical protein [Bacillus cereus group]|uniref:hypothetical protein n=1 Tax=Bacillus cereus group TaxID=86661 RepID=UPI000BF5BD40|nr:MULTISPECIES: hypothetical protein [Bacillus cereus group]MCU5356770.1 hypothetical protein [Bacillus cereus]PEV24305.1 hypothetical protein CN419_26590 [Bacillus cereus]PFI27308.1 hypothetical protein COI53_24505 [Bacillus thuringiensis]PFP73423.1 hypothetical protein COK07_24455 [Bacillus thuringiensis]GCF83140.1 hypothetical protein BCACH14_51160 [Bacillus cereus]